MLNKNQLHHIVDCLDPAHVNDNVTVDELRHHVSLDWLFDILRCCRYAHTELVRVIEKPYSFQRPIRLIQLKLACNCVKKKRGPCKEFYNAWYRPLGIRKITMVIQNIQ